MGFRFSDPDFQRVAVTPEHIEQFNLPTISKDKETIDKLNSDTRKNGFVEKYGRIYAVELDALLTLRPDEFKDIVQNSLMMKSTKQF